MWPVCLLSGKRITGNSSPDSDSPSLFFILINWTSCSYWMFRIIIEHIYTSFLLYFSFSFSFLLKFPSHKHDFIIPSGKKLGESDTPQNCRESSCKFLLFLRREPSMKFLPLSEHIFSIVLKPKPLDKFRRLDGCILNYYCWLCYYRCYCCHY